MDTGKLARDLAEVGASTKTLTERLAKDHTRRHAKDLANMNVRIKTLTGNRSKEGIGTDESRCGGPEEPTYGRLAVNTRLANSWSKNLTKTDASIKNHTRMHAKGHGEENASTKTLTVMPAKNVTGMHSKDLAEGSVRIKTLTGSRSKEGIGTDASIKTPTGILASNSKGETGAETSGETSGNSGGSPSGDSKGETGENDSGKPKAKTSGDSSNSKTSLDSSSNSSGKASGDTKAGTSSGNAMTESRLQRPRAELQWAARQGQHPPRPARQGPHQGGRGCRRRGGGGRSYGDQMTAQSNHIRCDGLTLVQ